MFQFVHKKGSGSGNDREDPENIRLIRSHAMQHVRRRERVQREGEEATDSDDGAAAPSSESAWRARRARQATRPELPPISTTHSMGASLSRPTVAQGALAVVRRSQTQQQHQSLPPGISSMNVNRTAIIEVLLQDYFGDARLNRDVERNVLCWSSARRAPMEEATSIAVSLLHLGSKTNDTRLLEEARRHYTVGLQLATNSTETPDLRIAFNTAAKLLSCDVYQIMGSESTADDALNGHIRGMCDIISATEHAGTLNTLSSFQLQHFRFKILLRSLMTRRSVVDNHVWQACSRAPLPSAPESLIRLAMQLVALLNTITSTEPQVVAERSTADAIMTQLLALESQFLQWLNHFRNATNAQKQSSTRDLLKLSYLSFHQICLMVLRQALLDFSSRSPNPTSGRNLPAEINQCAEYLCQVVYGQINSSGSIVSKAFLLRANLYLLTEWYSRTRNDAKLRWCHDSETWIRDRVPFLNWDRVLWFGFNAISWLEDLE